MKKYNIDGYKNLKAIIFDFDDTLYMQRNKEENYLNFTITTLCNILNMDRASAVKFLEGYDFFDISKRPRLTTIIKSLGEEYEEKYNQYRIDNFYMPNLEDVEVVPNSELQKLKSKYLLFLVTGEYLQNLQKKADAMGIDLSLFDSIRVGDIKTKKEKVTIYQELLNEYNLDAKNVIAIGDRFVVDIEPLIKLGGGGVLISNTTEVVSIINEL